MEGILTAWGRILRGYTPSLSIEITRECPLHCPGCYAYGDDHLGGDLRLRELRDFKGQALVDGVLELVERHRPLHLSIVGGEPLVRYRELDTLLPILAARGVYTQLVTSAVREIPIGWRGLRRLQIVVSIDGLQPEHDARRTPATYDRILKHIAGHDITVHCTVTRQQVERPGYIEEFLEFWQAQPDAKQIWMSLYTPQKGEVSAERLRPVDRERVISDLTGIAVPLLEAADERTHPAGVHRTSGVTRRLPLRAHDDDDLGGSQDQDHAVPVRGRARLQQLRVPRIGRPRGGRAVTGSSA